MLIDNDKELTENNKKILNFCRYDDKFWNWLLLAPLLECDGKNLTLKSQNNNPITILKDSETFKNHTKLLKQKNIKEKDEEER